MRPSRPALLFVLALLGVLAGVTARAQTTTLVPAGATWRYFKGTTEASVPRDAWTQLAFDDSTWLSGATPIGYGYTTPALATVLSDMQGSYASVFCRIVFQVPDPATVAGLQLTINYDDGFVAYLNGTEVARRGMGTPAPSNTRLAQDHSGGVDELIPLSDGRDLLVAGDNVLAIEIHNSALASSADCLLAPQLDTLAHDPVSRGPYLQKMREDSVVVRWSTTLPTDTVLEWGDYVSPFPAAFPNAIVDPTLTTEHEVLLSGLSPGSHYMYRAADSSGVRSEDLTFWTLVRLGARAFDFAVLGDSGTGESSQHSVARRIRERRPDFVLHAGDAVYPAGEAENYDQQVFVPNKLFMGGAALFPVPGEHDLQTGAGQPWLDAFSTFANNAALDERYYSFDVGNMHVTLLDSSLPAADFAAGTPVGDWLRQDLAAGALSCWRIVVLHQPLYTSDAQFADPAVQALRDALAPLFETAGVDVVFASHVDGYERSYPIVAGAPAAVGQDPAYADPPGPIYIVTGGGGQDLAPVPGSLQPFTRVALSAYHFAWCQVTDGLLTISAVDRAATTIDTFSIAKSCSPDADGDTVPDTTDNCAFVANPGQENLDGDTLGDACDPDADGDMVDAPADCDDRDPTSVAIPGEVTRVRVYLNRTLVPPTLIFTWNDPSAAGTSTRTQVLDGLLSQLRADRGYARATCALAPGDRGASVEIDPAAGSRYYLLRAFTGCGRGTYGDSGVTPDPRDALDTPGTAPCP